MGPGGPHRHRWLIALLAVAAVVAGALPAARGDQEPLLTPGAVAPGPVTGFTVHGDTAEISAAPAALRVRFLGDDVFRIWMAPNGIFTDPANTPPERDGAPAADVVVKHDYAGVAPAVLDAGAYYRLSTHRLALRVYKAPLRFGLYQPDDHTLIWEELAGPAWDGRETTQVLTRGPHEQFFGGGMQNGRFSHRDATIKVAVSYDWDDGGNPNSVPFYVSTAGYGVLRNTLTPGQYRFGAPVVDDHLVAGAHQARHHVQAHLAESDEPELHRRPS